jgi:hypothetical protein
MHTLKLNINDSVYEKFLLFLNNFQKEEIEVVSDDIDFQSAKKYLNAELEEIKSGKAKFYTMEEAEIRLEKVIQKYENIT